MEKKSSKETYRAWKEHTGAFLKKRGFSLVLLLCLLVIGAAATIAMLPQTEPKQTPAPAEQVGQSSDERLNERTGRQVALLNDLPGETPEPEETPEPKPTAKPTQMATNKGAAPVDGDIIWNYSMDGLIYSRTLEQWTTHAGVDIAAKSGTAVRACLPGEVVQVYEDDSLGFTVVIDHGSHRSSVYASLSKNSLAKEGQKVNAGDVIGVIGNTSVIECGEESHVHFEFLVDDQPVDPEQYVVLPKMAASGT